MNTIEIAEIISNQEIARGVFKLRLGVQSGYLCPEPGQFVNIYLNDESRLLPRPISVCDWEDGILTLVYAVVGEGTKRISGYGRGMKIRVSTPLGNGFSTESLERCVLVGGGVGVPPLLFMAKKLTHPAIAVLGFRNEPFLADEFPCAVKIATEDGSVGLKGNVIDLMETVCTSGCAQILACGPKPMLKVLEEYARQRSVTLQVSLEERMGCGYGACVGCVCKTTGGNRKICKDGPVFDASEVIWDE